MKKNVLSLLAMLLTTLCSLGQISGTKTIPGDYTSIASAISALNTSGVGIGGVTFNVTAGYTETFSNLNDGLITATGTPVNQVLFQKSGTGANPIITAAINGIGNYDYIFCIGGGDYITFNGIDVQDNPANATATTRMEFGFALFKASGTDGAQHNTLRNGTISLSFNTNAYGITLDNRLYSNPIAPGPPVTAVSGTNSWNDIRNITFSNCYGGINLKGFADVTPFAFYDQGNTIGVNGGNSFSYSGLAGTTANSYGINGIYQNGLIIANNTFSGSLSMTTGRYYAMNLLDAHNADLDVYNNTLSISFTGAGHFYGFYINGMLTSSNGSTNTVNFYNNQVVNNTFPNHTNGNVVYTYVVVSALNLNIYGNLISNNAIGSTTANSTGLVYYTFYRSDPAVQQTGAMNIYNNTISNNTRSSAAASVPSVTYFLYATGQTQTLNMYGNVIDNNTAIAAQSYGIICAHIGANKNRYNNQITNISGRNGSLRGIFNGNGIGDIKIHNNRIQNLSSDANPSTFGPTFYSVAGIQQSAGNNTYYYNNYISQIYAPFSQSPSAVTGIIVYGANNIFTGFYNNTIYLDGTSVGDGFGARGIYAETGTQLDLRNNIVVVNTIPTGAAGCNAAYSRNSNDLSTYQQVSDNNNFYAGTPGPHNLIYLVTNVDSVQTLSEYQLLVSPRDAHSVTELPPFINVSTTPYNLHLAGNVITKCESGGSVLSTPISLTVDFDGDPRYPNSGYPNNPTRPAIAPDMGADEFAGLRCIPVPTISGPGSACALFTGQIYTTEPGMTGYNWVMTGGTIAAGAGTNAITVTWNTPGTQTVSVNYMNTSGCSAWVPTVYNVTVLASPAPTITGSAATCVFSTNNTYSTQPGMTGYTWVVSAGGTITSGTGTNSITVTWSTMGAKTVSVNYSMGSGCSAPAPTVFNVVVNAVPTPVVTGPNELCANSGYITYTTETGMTGYNWNVSSGGTIISGQGTSAVQVVWNTSGAQNISVSYAYPSGCNAPAPTIYPVTVNGMPGAAGAITGISAICSGTMGVAYSCAPIPGTVYYVWTLPAGATIASGAGTNTITVDFSANASSGDITVYGNNLCGNGAASPAFPITVTPSAGAAGTISGQAAVCQGTAGVIYSVNPIVNATSYNWTVPSGATIVSGGTTNTITVNFGMAATSGTITVYGSNSCGNGTSSPALAVTVNPSPATPVVMATGDTLTSNAATGNQWYYSDSQTGTGNMIPGATSQIYEATQTGWYWTVVNVGGCDSDPSIRVYILITGNQALESDKFNIYPIPNNGRFTVSMTSFTQEKFTIIIYNNLGVQMHEMKNIEVNGQFSQEIYLRSVGGGIYTVVIRGENSQVIKKMIVRPE